MDVNSTNLVSFGDTKMKNFLRYKTCRPVPLERYMSVRTENSSQSQTKANVLFHSMGTDVDFHITEMKKKTGGTLLSTILIWGEVHIRGRILQQYLDQVTLDLSKRRFYC